MESTKNNKSTGSLLKFIQIISCGIGSNIKNQNFLKFSYEIYLNRKNLLKFLNNNPNLTQFDYFINNSANCIDKNVLDNIVNFINKQLEKTQYNNIILSLLSIINQNILEKCLILFLNKDETIKLSDEDIRDIIYIYDFIDNLLSLLINIIKNENTIQYLTLTKTYIILIQSKLKDNSDKDKSCLLLIALLSHYKKKYEIKNEQHNSMTTQVSKKKYTNKTKENNKGILNRIGKWFTRRNYKKNSSEYLSI